MPKKQLTSDEALVELFKASLDYSIASDKIYVDFLKQQIDFKQKLIEFKANEEPLKIFKKAHKKWEDEIDALEKELCDAYEKLGKEFFEQQEFYHKLKSSN